MPNASRTKKGTLELRRRVPVRYAAVEPRQVVWLSLGTDSASDAKVKGDAVWQQMVLHWEALLTGDTSAADHRLDAAREIARSRGFVYQPAAKVVEMPVEALLQRIEAITATRGRPNLVEARALLGTVPDPGLKVSKALEMFWDLTTTEMLGKSEDQVRRAKNPVIKAIGNFVEVIGDKDIAKITRDDMLDFRQWWAERLEVEELTSNSANKDLGHFGKVLKRVNELKRLNLDLPLGSLKFKQEEPERRPPFSEHWIRTKLLAPGALAGMNTEARCILLGMINTGYRPSEGAALLASHIHLEGDVPYIHILPEGRQVKTKNAKRTIPLAGISLDAIRECKNGFPRYRNKAGLSATINNFLRGNGLMETQDHVLYSLRHSFEDRLLAAGVDERIRRDLMGHALDRERYGSGASLEMALSLVQRVAL